MKLVNRTCDYALYKSTFYLILLTYLLTVTWNCLRDCREWTPHLHVGSSSQLLIYLERALSFLFLNCHRIWCQTA